LPPAPETIEAVQTVSTTLQLSVLSWTLTLKVVLTTGAGHLRLTPYGFLIFAKSVRKNSWNY